MAYAFVQQNANDNAATATTITVTLTPSAGNLLVFCVSGDALDTTSIALSDNLGVHNTFSQIATDLVTGSGSDQRCAWWYAANCKGGATTFTATYSATTRFRTIYVAEYSGIATSSPFLNGARQDQSAPGTGTDAVTSGVANATSQPALVWGFSLDTFTNATPTAGTGFTARSPVWSTNTCLARGEDKRVTATGNVAATFTTTSGADWHATGVGIFVEATTPLVDDDSMVVQPPVVSASPAPRAVEFDELPGTTLTIVDDSAPVGLQLGAERAVVPLPAAADEGVPGATAAAIDEESAPSRPSPAPPSPPRAVAVDELAQAAAPSSTAFPLRVSLSGRYLEQADGTPFLICAQSVWELAVNLPLADLPTFLANLVSQGFTALMSSAIEHNYTVVKPPKERGGNLPFTKRLDGATYTGSPNGTSSATGTHDQFGADDYSSPASQSPDPTFINNSYWTAIETVLDACLAANLAVFVWPAYLGFHAGDEGWMGEMVQWDAVTGAGGFTGAGFADPTKSKCWNYGAWLADRWKNYPNIIWVAGGDYGSNSQTLSTSQRAAVLSCVQGMKSVAGQRSTLWTAHWDRPCISNDTTLSGVTWNLNLVYSDEAVAEDCRRGYADTAVIPTFLGENNYEDGLFGGSAPYRKYMYWAFLGGIAGGFYGNEPLWRVDTDYATHMNTQGRQDATRQFALWKSLPWHRMKPSGLGGMGTIVTAGGGTASPQSTDYVAAAATAAGDLLLAYVPPAHTGSVTIDMTKMVAAARARWFDPTNGSFTAIGTIANTGTHAFSTPGTNSAGDADWLLLLDISGAELDEELPAWPPALPIVRSPNRASPEEEIVPTISVEEDAPPRPVVAVTVAPPRAVEDEVLAVLVADDDPGALRPQLRDWPLAQRSIEDEIATVVATIVDEGADAPASAPGQVLAIPRGPVEDEIAAAPTPSILDDFDGQPLAVVAPAPLVARADAAEDLSVSVVEDTPWTFSVSWIPAPLLVRPEIEESPGVAAPPPVFGLDDDQPAAVWPLAAAPALPWLGVGADELAGAAPLPPPKPLSIQVRILNAEGPAVIVGDALALAELVRNS